MLFLGRVLRAPVEGGVVVYLRLELPAASIWAAYIMPANRQARSDGLTPSVRAGLL